MRFVIPAVLAVVVASAAFAAPLEVVSYGDIAVRDNNLAGPVYQSGLGSWAETRIVYNDRSHAKNPRPYVKLNMALSSENIPEESTFTYGLGAERRRPSAPSRVIT